MFDISKRLLYYKKKEVQKLIVDSSIDKEVGIRYGNRGYGKRPDIFVYPNDVMETVKKGATSFHVSEERWINPLDISTNMSRKELDELRSGWDLVLDIDCPYWFLSKLTTHMFILALKEHKIKSISCKFSGNKGFHIGVPYEAFPTEVNSIPVKNWFPDGPKKIALYLLNYITTNFIKVKKDEIIFVDKYRTNIQQISKITGKGIDELSKNQCTKCKKELKNIEEKNKIEYLCSKCGNRMFMNEHKIMVCQKCSSLMKKIEHESSLCDCGSNDYETIFNPLSIVEVDTILISSRHMYRAPYGMHEKSGLISLPIKPDEVMKFEKEIASPDNFDNVEKLIFLDSRNAQNNEATQLMINSFDIGKEHFVYKKTQDIFSNENKNIHKEYEELTDAIPVENFPPCILKILEGLEDGKKRSMFILTNFLTSTGWSHNQAQELLLKWNDKNADPLNPQMIKKQISYHKRKKLKVLPPNCKSYYQDFQVCSPDNLCTRIKNPVHYAVNKSGVRQNKKTNYERLTDEQKKIRKEFRKKQREKTKLDKAQKDNKDEL